MINDTIVDGLTGTDPPSIPDFPETPYLILDPKVAATQYDRLANAFPDTQIFYAVKANPEPQIIRRLAEVGSSFDVASTTEIDICLSQGADPRTLSYGNTIKKAKDIRYAYERGVRMFVFDSEAELRKIASNAPGSEVFCRLLASSAGAQWPLSRKFGCAKEMAVDLLALAPSLGLKPIGVSFHVGSQQLDPGRWEPSVADAAWVFRHARERGLELDFLDIGGGFPVGYAEPVAPIEEFGATIGQSVRRHFGSGKVRVVAEPGRFIAAETGTLRAEVVLVSRKSYSDQTRWVYLDVGRFGGLAETEGEAIRYRIVTPHDGLATGPAAIAGPTCDSVDVLYKDTPYELPLALSCGDFVEILNTGAYTTTYSSVAFNGFEPLATFCIGDRA
jgi:diaminopimelate decarboxylase